MKPPIFGALLLVVLEILARGGVVPVVHVPSKGQHEIRDGQISAAGGEAAYQYIVKAVDLAVSGQIAVIVTAPLNKGAMHAAGHHFDGHTELLAARAGLTVHLYDERPALGGQRAEGGSEVLAILPASGAGARSAREWKSTA